MTVPHAGEGRAEATERRCRHCGELELDDDAAAAKGCTTFELERRSGEERRFWPSRGRPARLASPHNNAARSGLDRRAAPAQPESEYNAREELDALYGEQGAESAPVYCKFCGEEVRTNPISLAIRAHQPCVDLAANELQGLRAFKRSVNEALNMGDGSYRP